MLIGGYSMETHHNGLGVTVRHYESGWSFYMQGEDAAQFLDEWEDYEGSFGDFLRDYEYDTLLN